MIEPPKDPFGFPLLTYVWVIFISSLGGVVSFMKKVKQGETRACNITEFIGEIVTSAFSGMITFWLCVSANIDPMLTAALVGISGHMGGRAIYFFEKMLEKKLPTGGSIADSDSSGK